MNIQIVVTDENVNRMLFDHTGAYSPWLHELTGNLKDGALAKFDEENGDEGNAEGLRRFTYSQIRDGLQIMANDDEDGSALWHQFMQGDDDNVTFDGAWQFIIFGKIVYA